MKLSEIASYLGVGLSTAHRLLATLRESHFVRQEEFGKRYELGPALLFTAGISAVEHCVEVSAPVMGALRDRLGETVHLAALRGADCVFAASVESNRVVRVSSRVGQHPPAHTSAAGKVLLAALASDRFMELYPQEILTGPTVASLTTRSELVAQILEARERGYARNIGESETDMYAIAVPVVRPDGATVTSLTAAAPLSRMSPHPIASELNAQELMLIDALRSAARAIESRLAF